MSEADTEVVLDECDRAILNGFQGGFPVCERPFDPAANPDDWDATRGAA